MSKSKAIGLQNCQIFTRLFSQIKRIFRQDKTSYTCRNAYIMVILNKTAIFLVEFFYTISCKKVRL